MNLICKACGHKVRLSEQNATKFAGRRVKCPGCKEPIQVPAAANSQLHTAEPLSANEPPQAKPPAAALPPVAAAPPAAQPPAAAWPPAGPAPTIEPNQPDSGIGTMSADRDPYSPTSRLKKSKQQALPLPLLLIGGGTIAVALFGAVALGIMLNSGSNPITQGDSAGQSNLKVSGKGELTLDWPESARQGAKVQIDGSDMSLPDSGPVSYLIQAGEHRLVIRRRGYEQVEALVVVPEKRNVQYAPSWKRMAVAAGSGGGIDRFGNTGAAPQGGFNPDANFDDWLQDFEQAKATAASGHKDVLVMFNGSDWCPPCQRLIREVIFDNRFETLVGSEYVLVNIDFPRTPAARSKVESATRNDRLQYEFGVESYPTVLLTDSEGMPYAKLGYVQGGMPEFLEQVEIAQSIRQQRDDLINYMDQVSWSQRKMFAGQFMDLMSGQDLQWYYSDQYQDWFNAARKADPDNRMQYNEFFFQLIWMARLNQNRRQENESGLRTVVNELDQWKQKYTFRDDDRAANLHLAAAMVMYELSDPEGVNHFASAGTQYSPSDDQIASMLSSLSNMGDSINVLGNGTGFVIAEGGYVMTNHHVIDGAEKLAVRIAGIEELIPCRVIAHNEEHDLALVKVDDQAMNDLTPLSLTRLPPELANKISVLGYPLSDSLGNQIKFTSGEIAATADLQRNGMLLLDCTVNPGNSGGPLFNTVGDVIGIVTAKSVSRDGSEDTYGMAVTAQRAVEFLQQHLPGYQPPPPTNQEDLVNLPPTANWSAVVREVKGSVIQIVQLRN